MRSLLVLAGTVAVMIEHLALAQAPAGCIDPQVFTQCLSDQDIYLKTCKDQDFACLCKWNTVRLQCWDNSCPNDPARATQAGLVQNYCAIADVYSPLSSSTIPHSTQTNPSTIRVPSSSGTPSASSSPDNRSTSSGTITNSAGSVFVLAAAAATAAGLASGAFIIPF